MATSKKKKKKGKGWLILLLIVVALSTYIIFIYVKQLINEQDDFARYPAFGIEIPEGYQVHGIDVSRHQGTVAWPHVKNMQVKDVKLDFAFVKATEGLGNVDNQFRRNWIKMKEAGITRGAYHFFIAAKSGKAQAENFINTVQLKPGDLPPVLDIEQLYGTKPDVMRKQVKAWLQVVEANYKVKPIIYTYVSFYESYLGDEFDSYPLWVAHYFVKQKPRTNRSWLFWQHNDAGRVNGIARHTDFDVFSADTTTFRQLLLK